MGLFDFLKNKSKNSSVLAISILRTKFLHLAISLILAASLFAGCKDSDKQDVYVIGRVVDKPLKSTATLWKNGEVQNLSKGRKDAYAYSVYVSGNDVYIAGVEEHSAILWKKGNTKKLASGEYGTSAHSVFVK